MQQLDNYFPPIPQFPLLMLKLAHMDDFKNKVNTILDRGECLQIVSLPGMGVSRFAKNLGGLYLDTNSLPHPDHLTLLRLLASVTGIDNPSADPLLLYQQISQQFSHKPTILTIDSIEGLLESEFSTFFKLLKSLRDTHKYDLSIMFITMGASPVSNLHAPILGDLFSLVSEHILYFPPISDKELPEKIVSDYSPYIKYTPNQQDIKTIIKLSGGIPALVKICLQAIRDQTLDQLSANIRLQNQLGEIAAALGPNPDTQLLSRHVLLDTSVQIRSHLLRDYLAQNLPPVLSAAETRLFELLSTNLGKIVSKDQICEAVYPDVKNRAGISDHSIDQLIHRLREKINRDYQLITHRGLGYKLHSH